MDTSMGKTPISILQEVCTKRSITPQYDLIANEGAVHEPVFSFRVIAGDETATGSGSSKKKAKHNAAQSILNKMLSLSTIPGMEEVDSKPRVSHSAAPSDEAPLDDGIAGNPVGELQEFTQKRVLRPPVYEFANEQGPPHARQFVCLVRLGKMVEKAEGKSKKLAKRKVAQMMLHKLCTQSIVREDIEQESEESLPMASNDYTSLKENSGKVRTPTSVETKQIGQFYAKLRASTGKKIVALKMLQLNAASEDWCHILQEIAEEQKFEVHYINLPEISKSGKHQVLVQLATMPVAVCHGSDVTNEDAKSQAALHALQYLQIMTRKS